MTKSSLQDKLVTLTNSVQYYTACVLIYCLAGDVALVHPFLLHARGKNLGPHTDEGVRFLCHPCVRLKEHMDLHVTLFSLQP
jgi:hypothetical protein